jgi:hypothetical protein
VSALLVVRFLLELSALAALGYWGFRVGDGTVMKIVLGIGAPLIVAVVWGAFIAPRAAVSVPSAVRLGLEVLLFGTAVAALIAADRNAWGWLLAAVYSVDKVLLLLLERPPRSSWLEGG